MNLVQYFVGYTLSIFGGWAICWALLAGMRRTLGMGNYAFDPLALYVGGTERAVVTTLVIFTPAYVPAFIGGWVVLKIAAGWGRRQGNDAEKGHFLALVGSVISFAIAIGVGLWLDPSALSVWREAGSA